MQSVSLSQFLEKIHDYQYFIIDKKVYELHLKSSLNPDEKSVFFIEDPEKSKSFEVYEKVVDFFLDKNIKRQDTLVCIGGGATTDLGGFVASTILRGINWVAAPTTLLAMVDASIGGKVGINTPRGKNLVGRFHLPVEEIICEEFLSTLDDVQKKSGYGEILKYCFLTNDIDINADCDKIISPCVLFKKSIVEQDFKESGIREILNFGHTFGHAIEKCLCIDHGIAVAIGIKMNIALFSPHLLSHFEELIEMLDLNLAKISLDWNEFVFYIKQDKKNKNTDKIRFITIKDIGKTDSSEISISELEKRLKEANLYDHYFQ